MEVSQLRITRAQRDGAAVRIALALDNGLQPNPEDLKLFKLHRRNYSKMILDRAAKRGSK